MGFDNFQVAGLGRCFVVALDKHFVVVVAVVDAVERSIHQVADCPFVDIVAVVKAGLTVVAGYCIVVEASKDFARLDIDTSRYIGLLRQP